jgi:cysteine-rich repeat protein
MGSVSRRRGARRSGVRQRAAAPSRWSRRRRPPLRPAAAARAASSAGAARGTAHRARTAGGTRAVLLLLALTVAAPAHAVVRSCGSDALANTAAVLCAPPSGPCDAATVVVGAAIALPDGRPCTFDLGGRALVVARPIETTGRFGTLVGLLRVQNAGDVTITASGRLKARGDFVTPAGFIVAGGRVVIESSGTIAHAGMLDVTGDPAGEIVLEAAGDVTVAGNSEIIANGVSTFLDDGERFADGGTLEVIAGGSVTIDGAVTMTGQAAGQGGTLLVDARRDVTIRRKVDLTGGASDGGDFDVSAGDDVFVTGGIDVDSRNGGGFGGSISVLAGEDDGGDARPGGRLTVVDATLTARGSDVDAFGGDGGDVDLESTGNLRLANVLVRIDAASNFDGSAGGLTLDSNDLTPGLGPLDGDLRFDGMVSARGGRDGDGGDVVLYAGRNLILGAAIDLGGRDAGGDLTVLAQGLVRLDGPIDVGALDGFGDGGTVEVIAGLGADAPLLVNRDVVAAAGWSRGFSASIELTGCALVVRDGVKIDASGGTLDNGDLDLAALHPMRLGAGSQYLAGAHGLVRTFHPPGADPVIGAGVVFEPLRTDAPAPFPWMCPPAVCGNGVVEPGEECDDGNGDAGDGCSPACEVRCTTAPVAACRVPVLSGKAQLVLEDRPQDAKDRLIWRWLKGSATAVADFGDPLTDDDYALCIYDESGGPALVFEAAAPAGGMCAGHPCWKAVAQGFAYDDPERTPAGLDTIALEAGGAGDARIAVTGKGASLVPPPLPLALPARVQLQATNGSCWEATFSAASKNDGVVLEAVSD